MNKLFNTGAYIRLSTENTAYKTDSNSIENQRELLSGFISTMPNWVLEKFYIDNGYSGASFDRPAFSEMICDIKSGLINLVIVKDLSRFGRNYLQTGHYLEETFPALGCRFVSISEGIDSLCDSDGKNDVIPFLNAMNDYYAKSTSDKTRLILEAMAREGKKISGPAPYGYTRNPERPTQLIIDEYSAGIVKRIFGMRALGSGYGTIVKALNSDCILPPRLYSYENKSVGNIKTRLWTVSTIQAMLKKELYLGHAVQLIRKVVSYRDKREVMRSPDEHIRVENAFPAIIDAETWAAVQKINCILAQRYGKKRKPQKQLFSGIVFCAVCGAPFIASRSKRKKGNDYIRYFCKTYTTTGGCVRKPISETALISMVSGQLREKTEQVILNETDILEKLKRQTTPETDKSKEIHLLKTQIQKLEHMTSALFEDKIIGSISETTYLKLSSKNETELEDSKKKLAQLENTENELNYPQNVADIERWIELIKKKSDFTELTRDLLDSLVKRVEVGDEEVLNNRFRNVRITYKFARIIVN